MLVSFAVLVVGCGWKSGLDLGDEDDGGPPPGRDGGFSTLPCSWSWGDGVSLGRAPAFRDLRGAVHGAREEALVFAESAAGRIGARVSLFPARVIEEGLDDGGALDLAGHPSGWSFLEAPCTHVHRSDDFREESRESLGGPTTRCQIEDVDPAFFDISRVSDVRLGVDVVRRTPDGENVVVTNVAAGGDIVGFAGVLPPDGVGAPIAASRGRDGATFLFRETFSVGYLGTTQFDLAVDPLRSAAVFLYQAEGTSYRLERFEFTGTFEAQPLGVISETLRSPAEMVVNETEALLLLADGRVAIQPLTPSSVRILESPLETGEGLSRILDAQLLLRPGRSVGGVLYAATSEAGGSALRFRPLICNR